MKTPPRTYGALKGLSTKESPKPKPFRPPPQPSCIPDISAALKAPWHRHGGYRCSLSPRERVVLGAARIMTSADGTYRPDAAGEWAAILAVHDRFGELVDLVSWLPENPCRWWLRIGDETPVLGAQALRAKHAR